MTTPKEPDFATMARKHACTANSHGEILARYAYALGRVAGLREAAGFAERYPSGVTSFEQDEAVKEVAANMLAEADRIEREATP